jgi:hypothetical protein
MRRNDFLIFVFVFVCLFSQTLGDDNNSNRERKNYPVLRNGTYDIRESILLSQHWKVAVIDFEVLKEEEGELHFPVLVPCFECLSKTRYTSNEEGEACVCNFASKSKEECGKAPKGCPSSTCDPSEMKRKCFDEKGEKREWTELHVSQTQKEDFTRLRNQSLSSLHQRKYFRFHSSDPCRGYKIKVHFHSGLVDLLLSREHAWPDDLHQEWSTTSETYPDATEIPLCPDFKSFGLGTYYLAVVSRTPEAVFDLLIYTQESTLDKPEFKGQTNELCDGGTHTCLHPGVPFKFTQSFSGQSLTLPFQFDFPVKKGECKTITVYLNADEGDAGLAGDFELQFPNYYYGGNPQFHSEYPGSDFHHFQRCFEEIEGMVSYYLSVFVWTPGNFTLRVSLNKTPILVSTSELTPYQYAFSSIRTLIGKV